MKLRNACVISSGFFPALVGEHRSLQVPECHMDTDASRTSKQQFWEINQMLPICLLHAGLKKDTNKMTVYSTVTCRLLTEPQKLLLSTISRAHSSPSPVSFTTWFQHDFYRASWMILTIYCTVDDPQEHQLKKSTKSILSGGCLCWGSPRHSRL